jgi:hypothetical protein
VSRLRADTLTDRTGTSAPDLTHGATSTTGTFSGDLGGGNVNLSGNATVDGTLTYQDADNINSTGIITARQGIQVSANGFDVTGISTFNSPITVAGITTINESGLHATGVVTATSFAGDGSALTGTNRTISGIASGTLANGQTVIIHSDGKVGFITETAASSTTYGTSVAYNSVTTNTPDAVYVGSGKIVVAYVDADNSDHGKAVVGTVSGTSISFGSPVTFEAAETIKPAITYDANADKVVIAYTDNGNSNYGTAIVGTVSGTSISFGSAVVYRSAESRESKLNYDANAQKIVLLYRDDSASNVGKGMVGTVSGSSISFGSETTYSPGSINFHEITYDENTQKHVVAYVDGNYNLKVATVSGTSISFGSELQIFSGNPNSGTIGITYDASAQKVVAIYGNGSDNKGYALVGTISGTDITVGSASVIVNGYFYEGSITYDSNTQKNLVAYSNNSNSRYGESVLATVSGTSVSAGSTTVYNSVTTNNFTPVHDSQNKKVVVTFTGGTGGTGYGFGIVGNNLSTNLTAENFIGFSDAAYTNGQTATVQIITALDDAQSGLTTGSKHYVQNDGTLSTTAGSPSVLAGTAISDTEIIVKQ